MATAKKAISKKVVAKKPVKKVTAKSTNAKRSREMKSFQLHNDSTPFLQFLITEQTVYWSILLVLILALGIWVLKIQMDISNILDGVQNAAKMF